MAREFLIYVKGSMISRSMMDAEPITVREVLPNEPDYKKLAEELAEAMEYSDRHWIDVPTKGICCSTCDMGDAGYSSKGSGYHDDACLVFRCHEALAKYRAVLEKK